MKRETKRETHAATIDKQRDKKTKTLKTVKEKKT